MRILICGSRDYSDYIKIRDAVLSLFPASTEDISTGLLPKDTVIIAGGAKGADSLAADVAAVYWTGYKEYKADWNRYGKAAGSIRNKQMLEEGKPDLVLAFPSNPYKISPGTANMIAQARKAGIEVRVIV